MPVSKDFLKGLESTRSSVKRFNEAKKAKPSDGGGPPDIENGQYFARINIDCSKDTKGVPVVTIRQKIVSGDYNGLSWGSKFWLAGDDDKQVQMNWDKLSRAIQVLADVDEEDFNSWKLPQLVAVLAQIDEEPPYCSIGVKNTESNGKEYVNVYYNKLVDADDIPDMEDSDEGEDQTWAELGQIVDDEEDGAEEAQASLTEAAEANELDADEYGTWFELGEYLDSLEGEDEGEEEESEDGEEEGEEEGEDDNEEQSWEELGELADADDEDALASLTSAAEEAGLDPDDFGTWAELATALSEGGEEEGEDEGEEEVTFAKGDIVWHKPKGKKTQVEYKVTTVSVKNRTATIARTDDPKDKVSDVSWDNLTMGDQE